MLTFIFAILNLTHALQTPLFNKIVSQGVPAKALTQALQLREKLVDQTLLSPIYHCQKKNGTIDSTEKPCVEEERLADKTTSLKIPSHPYIVIIDFGRLSTQKRFFLIHLPSGAVNSTWVSHGLGTGENEAVHFSNIKDSKKTSLGIYLATTTYSGKYGKTLRLHGLSKSNDQAYNRDIVLHGAWYSQIQFTQQINSKTGGKYNRLGVSWGCPAIPPSLAKKWIPLLENGALIYHYHPLLMEESQQTGELTVPLEFFATE